MLALYSIDKSAWAPDSSGKIKFAKKAVYNGGHKADSNVAKNMRSMEKS